MSKSEMSYAEIRKVLADTARLQRRSSIEAKQSQEERKQSQEERKQSQEERKQSQEERKQSQEKVDRQLEETGLYIKELGKQIGGIGNKFGTFTEGLSIPSLEKILREQFGMSEILPKAKSTRNGANMELDMVGLQKKGGNRAVIVEIKSKVTAESIAQLRGYLESAGEYFSSLEGKVKVGILAGVSFSKELIEQTQKEGFYCALINDDLYSIQNSKDFRPREYP